VGVFGKRDHDVGTARRCPRCALLRELPALHRCLSTEAITAPFELDARRCIAYLTIEKDGSLDEELRGKMQGWIFGCDICQEVCPHNGRKKEDTRVIGGLVEILEIKTDSQFHEHFAGTAFLRAGRESLIRNACVAAANLGRTDLTARLRNLSKNDSSSIVREYAIWALAQLSARPVSTVLPA